MLYLFVAECVFVSPIFIASLTFEVLNWTTLTKLITFVSASSLVMTESCELVGYQNLMSPDQSISVSYCSKS